MPRALNSIFVIWKVRNSYYSQYVDLLHSDVFIMVATSIGGALDFISFVEENLGSFAKSKDEAFSAFVTT